MGLRSRRRRLPFVPKLGAPRVCWHLYHRGEKSRDRATRDNAMGRDDTLKYISHIFNFKESTTLQLLGLTLLTQIQTAERVYRAASPSRSNDLSRRPLVATLIFMHAPSYAPYAPS